MSSNDNLEDAKAFIEKWQLEGQAYYDVDGDFYKNYPIVAVPTAFHIDSDHNLLEIIQGPEDVEVILEKVDEK